MTALHQHLFILIFLSSYTSEAKVKLKSMEVFTDIRMNLAVTWVKISYTGQTEGYNEFRFSLPIPTDSVLSNLTIMTTAYNMHGISTPMSIDELKQKLRRPKRKPNFEEFELVEIDHMTVYGGETVTALLCYEELLELRDDSMQHVVFFRPFSPLTSSFRADVRVVEPQGLYSISEYTFRSVDELSSESDSRLPQSEALFMSSQKAHVQMRATSAQIKFLSQYNIRGRITLKYKVRPLSQAVGKLYINGGFFLYKFSPTTLAPTPKNVVFLLDTSASIEGVKLQSIKEAFVDVIGNLSSEDRFTVMSFASQVTTLTKEMKDNNFEMNSLNCLLSANDYNKLNAVNFINNLIAEGDTDINLALTTALECFPQPYDATNLIFFVADGNANVGQADIKKIMSNVKWRQRKLKTKAHLFSVALGSDVDYPFIQQLSRQNHGHAIPVHVTFQAQIVKSIKDFYRCFSKPTLRNVIVSFAEMHVSDISATSFVTYYLGSEVWVTGKLAPEKKNEVIQASVYGRASDGSAFLTTVASAADYPSVLTDNKIQGKETSPLEQIYALKRTQEKMALAASGNLEDLERLLLWTEVQILSTQYNFMTSVMHIDMVADMTVGASQSLKVANENYLTVLENKSKQTDVKTKPKPSDSKYDEAFEGADGDPHFIVQLPNLTLCFNVGGRNNSVISLLNDANGGVVATGLLGQTRNSYNESASYFTKIFVHLYYFNHSKNNSVSNFIEFNPNYVQFMKEKFYWKVGSAFQHGRITINMAQSLPESELHYGENFRLKIFRHKQQRKYDGSKFSFMGVYIMNGTLLSNDSQGFLGKEFLQNVSVSSVQYNESTSSQITNISINNKIYASEFKTVIDNSSKKKKQCYKLLGSFFETIDNYQAISLSDT